MIYNFVSFYNQSILYNFNRIRHFVAQQPFDSCYRKERSKNYKLFNFLKPPNSKKGSEDKRTTSETKSFGDKLNNFFAFLIFHSKQQQLLYYEI